MIDETASEAAKKDGISKEGVEIKENGSISPDDNAVEQKSDTDKKPVADKSKPKKKKKVKYIDDGHTVYSMEGLDEARGIKRRGDSVKLSRKERWAAIRAAFARFFPIFLGVVGCFSLAALLLYFWLR